MESSNRGGRRQKHPDAGKLVKALLNPPKPYNPDPRVDTLIDIGLLLTFNCPVTLPGGVVLDKIMSEHPRFSLFVAAESEEVIFEATVSDDAIQLGPMVMGPWVREAKIAARTLRAGLRTPVPEEVAP